MPLIAWLILAYLCGLLAAFGGIGAMAGLCAAAVGVAAFATDRPNIATGATGQIVKEQQPLAVFA